MLGQYLLQSEKDYELNVEGIISNSKRRLFSIGNLRFCIAFCHYWTQHEYTEA